MVVKKKRFTDVDVEGLYQEVESHLKAAAEEYGCCLDASIVWEEESGTVNISFLLTPPGNIAEHAVGKGVEYLGYDAYYTWVSEKTLVVTICRGGQDRW